MGASEKLRETLDGRGVAHTDFGDMTIWDDPLGRRWCASEQVGNSIDPASSLHLQAMSFLSPTDVVALTVGPGGPTPTEGVGDGGE